MTHVVDDETVPSSLHPVEHGHLVRKRIIELVADNLDIHTDIEPDAFCVEGADREVTYLTPGPDVFDTSKRLRHVRVAIVVAVSEVLGAAQPEDTKRTG